MAEKITVSSTNPAFVDFPQWIIRKIVDLRTNGEFAAADQIQTIMDAKKAAEQAGGWSMIANEGLVYTVSSAACPTTPEHEILWEEWKDLFDVQIVVETI